MALTAYIAKIEGNKNKFEGSVTQKGREKWIQIIAVEHEIFCPFDSQTGLATGKRQHGEYKICVELERTFPTFYDVMCNNENLKTIQMKFFTPQLKSVTGQGLEVNHFNVTLTNARCAKINFKMLNNRNPDLQKYPEHAWIHFVYEQIEWVWTDGGITAMDSWEISNQALS
jgi:type VI secretion system secreted protein Hcp